jgi:transposase
MEFITRRSRNQIVLLPDSIEEYVEEGNAVRVIEAYINLKFYVYGYMNRVRSSRRSEAETKWNGEVMWLLGKLSPDHKTIALFRQENTAALKKVFRNFVVLCVKPGSCGKELVAIDGSKSRAANGKTDVCYNVQTAVEAKNKLVAEFEASNAGTEHNQLTPMAERFR